MSQELGLEQETEGTAGEGCGAGRCKVLCGKDLEQGDGRCCRKR